MKQKIVIPRVLVTEILNHAQQNPEIEVCGLIGGHPTQALSGYPIDNIAEDPACTFFMDPSQQIQTMRMMREKGETLFGIYHSHPHSPAIPSAKDIDEAAYPDAFYFIVSLNTKGVALMNGFTIHDKQATPVEFMVVEESMIVAS